MGACCSKKAAVEAAADTAADKSTATTTEFKIETIAANPENANGQGGLAASSPKTQSKLNAKSNAGFKIDELSPLSESESDTGIKSSLSVTSALGGSAISRTGSRSSSRMEKDDEDMRPGSRASQAGSKAKGSSSTGSKLDSNYESVASTFGK